MKFKKFLEETKEQIRDNVMTVAPRFLGGDWDERKLQDRTAVAASAAEMGDWYFIQASFAYIEIITILEKHADNMLTFLGKAVASKGNADWNRIRELAKKIDAARLVPLIFHPYLDTSRQNSRYFLRANDACFSLANIIHQAISRFFREVKVHGLVGGLINRFGNRLRKSQAALENRMQRYQFNAETEAAITDAAKEQAAIAADLQPLIDKISDREQRASLTETELKAAFTKVIAALEALDMTRPAQLAQYLRDETCAEFKRLNEKHDAYRGYFHEMCEFLKLKYPEHNSSLTSSPSAAVELLADEYDARNALVLKSVIVAYDSLVGVVNGVKLIDEMPGIRSDFEKLNVLITEKVNAVLFAEYGDLDQVVEWTKSFDEQIIALFTSLSKYKAFNSEGWNMFKSKAEVSWHALAKDAYFQVNALKMLSAGVHATVAFAKRDTQAWIAEKVKLRCEDLLEQFKVLKGEEFEAAKTIQQFLTKHSNVLSLDAFRESRQQGDVPAASC